jgi:acylphosphatase
MMVARRYLVSGQVQGVGFRVFIEEAARREGLTGFVRNLDDGRVEAVAEGDAEEVARFERALHLGPPLARVAHVAVEDRPPEQKSGEFEIRG